MNRMIIKGLNGTVSPRPFQDAAVYSQSEPGMELYTARLHAEKAGEYLLLAHHDKANGRASDFYHRAAMEQLDKLAETLGLELVPREDLVTR